MGSSGIQLIILAAIALFLILKLRKTLGTRDGFESGPNQRTIDVPEEPRREFEVIEGGVDRDIAKYAKDNEAATNALLSMKGVEPNFNVGGFMQGARKAYEWILIAFAEGRLDEIKPYLSSEVLESFEQTIADRDSDDRNFTTTFVGIRDADVLDAEFDVETSDAEITVEFVCDLISYVTDSDDNLVEGDTEEVRAQTDVWTFSRTMGGGKDPNWKLVATGG